MELIGSGAEARIFLNGASVTKERPVKSYRLPFLDKKLRSQRTRREASMIERASKHIPCPELIKVCEESMKIDMSFIAGPKVRDVLTVRPELAREIGRLVGKLHSANIIHADLTTSNMILKNDVVHLVDFGLSFVSVKEEDKAVDLHVLTRALESAHHDLMPAILDDVYAGYKETNRDAAIVLERLAIVEKRGRNKK